MDKAAVYEIVRRFVHELHLCGITVKTCMLYGSYARGDARDDSDIDLAVISDDFSGMGYWERIDVLSRAIYRTRAPIEATAFTAGEFEHGNRPIIEFAKGGEKAYAV